MATEIPLIETVPFNATSNEKHFEFKQWCSNAFDITLAVLGFLAVMGIGFSIGWLSADYARRPQYTKAIEYIARHTSREEGQRFGELTDICKDSTLAPITCYASYSEAHRAATKASP